MTHEDGTDVSTRNRPARVSVVVPVYNGSRFLPAALDSILGQTLSVHEIIVVDDGSTDETPKILQSYAERDARIRVTTHDRNRGLSAARNSGFEQADDSAEYLMNHDCDDISAPGKIASLVSFLARSADVGAAGSFCEYIDADGKVTGTVPIEWSPRMIRATFGLMNSMVISATLIRKRLLKAIGPFRGEWGGCDDYDFWSRALQAGFRLANVPKVLHYVRVHDTSMGSIQRGQMAGLSASIGDAYRRSGPALAWSPFLARGVRKTLKARIALRRLAGNLSGA
jgi:glycosyltransferase involved in cell wall biosynthesis